MTRPCNLTDPFAPLTTTQAIARLIGASRAARGVVLRYQQGELTPDAYRREQERIVAGVARDMARWQQ